MKHSEEPAAFLLVVPVQSCIRYVPVGSPSGLSGQPKLFLTCVCCMFELAGKGADKLYAIARAFGCKVLTCMVMMQGRRLPATSQAQSPPERRRRTRPMAPQAVQVKRCLQAPFISVRSMKHHACDASANWHHLEMYMRAPFWFLVSVGGDLQNRGACGLVRGDMHVAMALTMLIKSLP